MSKRLTRGGNERRKTLQTAVLNRALKEGERKGRKTGQKES